MTTRITLAILLITWTMIVVGDWAAYVTARETLLTLLDDSLTARASALLDYHLDPHAPISAFVLPGDTYVIRDQKANVVSGGTATTEPASDPQVVNKSYEQRDGTRYRTITLSANDPQAHAMTIVYSRSMERFDDLLNYLLAVLSSMGVFCGFATAWVALKVSRAALRPLRETADVIAAIDEKNLSSRIDAERLPIELVPMTRRLNEMLGRLETVFTQRKQFLADAAHELRTPIAAMMTTLEVALRRQRDPDALREALQTALIDARMLRKLVERLMEHARSDHAVDRPAVEEFDAAEMLRECAATVRTLAEEKKISILLDVPPEARVSSQRGRLQSIALNLLSNAIEYNQVGGTVEVRCSVGPDELELVVRDTGQGISPEHLPHICEPFYRADREKQGDTAHLGLGLFLVQSHVKALGGRCSIDSEKGVGTTVRITMPTAPDSPVVPAEQTVMA